MGKVYDVIDERLSDWLSQQHVFFVATAPLDASGLVNCSPKGGDAFRVLGPTEVAYQDLTGSGVETIAHLRENARIVLMFCAFEGAPKIVRLHGRGSVVRPGDAKHAELSELFPPHPGTRAFIHVEVSRIADSCGYAVPLLEFQGDRDLLDKWTASKGQDGLVRYRREKNALSLDGLPGIDAET